MTRRLPAPSAELRERGGVQVRLLLCDTCRACWPTERDESHGGSRQDGEPCAYRWPSGKVCRGHVHPLGWQHPPPEEPAWEAPPEHARVYRGDWCAVFGVPFGTSDLARVRRAYRALVKEAHPDHGGSHARMVSINEAYRQALAELAQPGK